MQWLLHGRVSGAAAEALARHGHVAHQPTEAEVGADAPAIEVVRAAGKRQWDLLTTDADVAAAPFEAGEKFGRCIVFLQLAGDEVEQDDAIDRLFKRYKRLSTGRLYTVTASRVKVRQLPGRRA